LRTIAFGKRLGARLQVGDVIALIGDLGAGKTTLAKGIAEGLGVRHARSVVVSPTFVLVRVYRGRWPVYHIDLHRLHHQAPQVLPIGWDDLVEGDGVAMIEWAQRAIDLLPSERLEVYLESAGERGRRIRVVPIGARYAERWPLVTR